MAAPQRRQRARSSRKLSTGILSYQAIMAPQSRQCERGLTTDSSAAMRVMQTFAKLPKSNPKTTAKIPVRT